MCLRLAARAVLIASLAFLFVALLSPPCGAETLAAPVGGRPIPLGPDRVGCKDGFAGGGWTLEPDAHAVRPPAKEEGVGEAVTLRVAPNDAGCATTTASVGLVALGAKPAIDPSSVVVDVDAGRVVVKGKRMKGAVLVWSASANAGGRRGDDACAAPEIANGVETCAFAVPRDLPADPTSLDLAVLPAGANAAVDAIYDPAGRRVSPSESAVRPAQVLIDHIALPDAAVDLSSGTGRLALAHAEAIASVDCTDALCAVDGTSLVVRGEHGSDDKLEVRARLRPHVALRDGTTTETMPVFSLHLQRCPVALASVPPLAGVADQRMVIRIGGSCGGSEGDFTFSTRDDRLAVERTAVVGSERFAVVRASRIERAPFALSVQRRGTVVGVASITPRPFPPLHARLEIPEHGEIDFIPTNRWAKATLSTAVPGGSIEPIPVEGAYDVRRDDAGTWIRGANGASGAAFVRFALVDRSLPEPLRETRLAEIAEPVDRQLRAANVPVPLGALARSPQPLVEVLCGDGEGHARQIPTEALTSIPFRARDTCQVVLHRERLREEDGAQAFQVSIEVSSSDGAPRSEARIERKHVLRHADRPAYVGITGVKAPFDRILVRVAVADDETHYVEPSPEQGAPAAEWSIVSGTDHVRLYGTATIPTGLFRVADQGHSGILTLSVGALIRAVLLSREGTEFPLGLEAGAMWLGIAGDTDPGASSRGAVALVAGPGISVPIANVSRSTQTSISLHAWFEYEVSRTVLGQSGRPFGFVFGPSISIGDVGTSF